MEKKIPDNPTDRENCSYCASTDANVKVGYETKIN